MADTIQPTDADENMRLAVEQFRTKMESANRQFLQDRVNEIEAMDLSTEEEKISEMRVYWSGLGKTPEIKHTPDTTNYIRQIHEQAKITRLADVPSIYHRYMDGIIPPSLLTDEFHQMFLETIQTMCNEAAFREEDEDFQIPLCHDLGSFIKYANGVYDPDFRYSGIAPFRPVFGVRRSYYTFDDNGVVPARPAIDISKAREMVEYYLKQFLCDGNFIEGVVDEDLEARVGFITGTGCQNEHDKWYSTYLYCRRFVDDSDPSHKDWAWRVAFCRADRENPSTLYGRKPRFDSICEFLEWYNTWPDYITPEKIEMNVLGFESDNDMSWDMCTTLSDLASRRSCH
ncbi:hypothetical protein PVAR5_6490 [Paecilomyces variotii No. 5]|uniref:Uncharacterized protein n=1 Tax=Byssochlamys spectabilis (strain No. 5 / NBRC 109023) TaxID=1356009 RepID=V5G0C6_BYSSN|nr:hypothetical protein PVAR5_6490 [Paecilomyces variotii No. 5]